MVPAPGQLQVRDVRHPRGQPQTGVRRRRGIWCVAGRRGPRPVHSGHALTGRRADRRGRLGRASVQHGPGELRL